MTNVLIVRAPSDDRRIIIVATAMVSGLRKLRLSRNPKKDWSSVNQIKKAAIGAIARRPIVQDSRGSAASPHTNIDSTSA
jgi:hypothetical protein